MTKSFLELVEMEVRELLSSYEYGFPGDDIPIVKLVQPLLPLKARTAMTISVKKAILKALMEAVDDSYIPTARACS